MSARRRRDAAAEERQRLEAAIERYRERFGDLPAMFPRPLEAEEIERAVETGVPIDYSDVPPDAVV